MPAIKYVFDLWRALPLCSHSRDVAGIVQQISIKGYILGYIPGSHDFKVATAVIESSYGWKLLNAFFQQKASCSRQAGDEKSSG